MRIKMAAIRFDGKLVVAEIADGGEPGDAGSTLYGMTDEEPEAAAISPGGDYARALQMLREAYPDARSKAGELLYPAWSRSRLRGGEWGGVHLGGQTRLLKRCMICGAIREQTQIINRSDTMGDRCIPGLECQGDKSADSGSADGYIGWSDQ